MTKEQIEEVKKIAVPLSKEHGFIAVCKSDLQITEEIKKNLKDTLFIGDEDCNYCFEITEIIETDRARDEAEY